MYRLLSTANIPLQKSAPLKIHSPTFKARPLLMMSWAITRSQQNAFLIIIFGHFRDLAARNILVASDELVKISDFGLARSMADDKDVYVMSTQTNIPVKWLALECLKHNVYSTYSDVWSFGVVLWEMFSFGKSPFLDGCENFFQVTALRAFLNDVTQIWHPPRHAKMSVLHYDWPL